MFSRRALFRLIGCSLGAGGRLRLPMLPESKRQALIRGEITNLKYQGGGRVSFRERSLRHPNEPWRKASA
jgi:hypothetical protein